MAEEEVVIITGAGAGIGRAAALEFARHKAKIGLISRNRERLESLAVEIEQLGGQALALPADIANAEQVREAAERIEAEFGPVDVWVNNAMTTVFAPFSKITPEEYKRATEVTYLGTVYGTMQALKSMKPRGRGVIVQVGSALAYRAIPLQSPYCGAKHAIRGFTDSIRSELIHDKCGVHITMVHLPAVNTPQFDWCLNRLPKRPQPVPPIFQPEVAARAIYWAAHHRRRELLVGFPTFKAVTANKFFPGLLDRILADKAYTGQQTAEDSTGRPYNLFESVPGNFSGHGRFDSRAREESGFLRLNTNRAKALAAAGVFAALAAGSVFLALKNAGKNRNTSPDMPEEERPDTLRAA